MLQILRSVDRLASSISPSSFVAISRIRFSSGLNSWFKLQIPRPKTTVATDNRSAETHRVRDWRK